MALNFAAASTEYADRADLLGLTAVPFTFAVWFKPNGFAADHGLMSLGDTAVDNEFFRLRVDGTAVRFDAAGGGGVATASSSAAATDAVWNHCAAVATTTTSRAAFLNGANKGTNTDSRDPFGSTLTTFSIGRSAQATPQYTNGDLAEAAVWNVALTDDEVAALGKGVCPLLIRPTSLVAYWPLLKGSINISTTTLDRWKNRYDLTEGNTPTVSDHPRIYYPEGY
jgi:hypothetical protein